VPIVRITSLPFKQAFDVPAAIVAISKDFSAATGVAEEHVTVTWQYFSADHYAANSKTVSHQPHGSHPVLVDLLAPDFNTLERIETMLRSLASSIAAHCTVAPDNIFIHCHTARSGNVFDVGDIVRWS